MNDHNYTTTFTVDHTPEEAFAAINNVRGWWSEEIEGDTDKLGAEFSYHFKDVHRCKLKITEVIPGKKVVWLVLDNYFSFTKDKTEWKGTEITFEVSKKGDKTEIHFTHLGLVPEYECYDVCSDGWGTYINGSLRDLITTGKGQPNVGHAITDGERALDTQNYTTTLLVAHTPREVFNAVNNVRGWWPEVIEGSTDKLNDEFIYQVKDIHYSKIKVIEVIPDTKVVWLVTDSSLTYVKDKSEWTGTKVRFEISEQGNKTQLLFTHEGLVPKFECYGDCSTAWTHYVQESLVGLITTGKGHPNQEESDTKTAYE